VIVVAVLLSSGAADQEADATPTPEVVAIVPTLDGEAEISALDEAAESEEPAPEIADLTDSEERDEPETEPRSELADEAVEDTPSTVTPEVAGLLETVAATPPSEITLEAPTLDASALVAPDTGAIELTETLAPAVEEPEGQTAPDAPVESEAETLPESTATDEIIPAATPTPTPDEAFEIAAQETFVLEEAATREAESPPDDLEISEEPLGVEEIGVLVPSTDQEALLQTVSAFALTEEPFVLVETSLGATLLVRVCTTEGPELRSNLEPIMDALAAGADQLEASVAGVGVQFINCAVERTLRIIAVSRETAAAYSAGAVSRDAFAGAWRAQ